MTVTALARVAYSRQYTFRNHVINNNRMAGSGRWALFWLSEFLLAEECGSLLKH